MLGEEGGEVEDYVLEKCRDMNLLGVCKPVVILTEYLVFG